MSKKLTRVENGDESLGGVALGIARFVTCDVWIVRAILLGLGFLLPWSKVAWIVVPYALMWLVLPVDKE